MPSGLVVTNNHVIDGADQVKISLADKREFAVDVVLKDPRTDLAVLRVKDGNSERFPVIEFGNSDELQVGDVVLAVGNPFGVGQTVTHGIVSAVARTQVGISDYQFFIQTDAAINPGNSGGALVDMAGRLVGINTAIFSRSGGSQGVGFAIPATMVRVVVASARAGGSAVKRPWLGAKLQALTPELSQRVRPQAAGGRRSSPASPTRSPAARAGLKTGDVIVSVGGQAVDDPNAFDYRFTTHPLGGKVELGVVRGGRESKLAVALETAPESPRDEILIEARSPFLGAKVANLSPALADELRLDAVDRGRGRGRHCRRHAGPAVRLPARRHRARGQRRQDRQDPRPGEGRQGGQPAVAHHHPARRPADFGRVRRMMHPLRGSKDGVRACPNLRAAVPEAHDLAPSGAAEPVRGGGLDTTHRGRSPTSCGRRSLPMSSARTICSGPTAR